MPPLSDHLKKSKERTGNEYREVHEWLDGNPEKAAERHDITRMYMNGKMFDDQHGSEARAEYIEHIREDMRVKFNSIRQEYEKNMAGAMAYFGVG